METKNYCFSIILLMSLSIFITNLFSQNSTIYYYVNAETLNMRSGPGVEYPVIQKLNEDDNVMVLDTTNREWWLVSFNDVKGYVSSKFLSPDFYYNWQKVNHKTGDIPECENISLEFDYQMDNFLTIHVGQGIDVIVKLMKMTDSADICIRITYIKGGESFSMKYIPQGNYYLKIAYGKDFRQKYENGICYVKFTKNSHYEKGTEILKFGMEKNTKVLGNKIIEEIMFPSYELYLYVILSKLEKNFNSKEISEDEFNK